LGQQTGLAPITEVSVPITSHENGVQSTTLLDDPPKTQLNTEKFEEEPFEAVRRDNQATVS
jgi:hypothetical protein